MKLQFDANQEYQKKTVRSTVGLFSGQANNQLKTNTAPQLEAENIEFKVMQKGYSV